MEERNEINEVEKLKKILQHNLRVYDTALMEKRMELKEREGEILTLRSELGKLGGLKKEKDELVDRLAQAEETLKDAQEKVAKKLQAELEKLQGESGAREKLEAETQKLRNEFGDRIQILQKLSTELEEKKKLEEEQQKLRSELEEKLKLIEGMRVDIKAKEKLGVEIEILKRYNDEKKTKITELENLLAERSRVLAEKEALVRDIAAKRERVKALMVQASAKRKEAPLHYAFDVFLENYKMRMNPFQDKIISPEIFINKDADALQRVLRATRHNQSSISFLIGPTGSGKSENADFIVRNLPENYVFWYNQVYGQSAKELAASILGDIDEKFRDGLRDKMREEVINTFNMTISALGHDNKKLLCLFDQGEHFSRDAMEFVINSTNPHYASNRTFTALVLAVPRLEHKLDKLMKNYDTTLKRALVREYMRPFSPTQRVEYILRALSVSRGKAYEELMASRELAPFTEEAVNSLVEISRGHPSTLADLCYTSMEIASLVAKDAKVEEETVKEAWAKYPNKPLHEEAVKWYEGKGLYPSS